jgi:hypothetical protein
MLPLFRIDAGRHSFFKSSGNYFICDVEMKLNVYTGVEGEITRFK